MSVGTEITLKKLSAHAENSKALFTGYELKGTLWAPLEVGHKIEVLRTNRNGVERPGVFTSSAIQKIEGNKFYTANSVWQIDPA